MLFRQHILDGIKRGEVTLAFRRWRRASPVNGATITTAIGVLRLDDVRQIEEADVSPADLRRAGVSTWPELAETLAPEGVLYRMTVRLAGDDPRVALRDQRIVDPGEWEGLIARLQGLDRRAPEAWTTTLLQIVAAQPATLAATLAAQVQMDRDLFKHRMRALKGLGLTESLEVGYRLSPRGEDALKRLLSRQRTR